MIKCNLYSTAIRTSIISKLTFCFRFNCILLKCDFRSLTSQTCLLVCQMWIAVNIVVHRSVFLLIHKQARVSETKTKKFLSELKTISIKIFSFIFQLFSLGSQRIQDNSLFVMSFFFSLWFNWLQFKCYTYCNALLKM